MKKDNKSFIDFALSKTPNSDTNQWLRGVIEEFSGKLACDRCYGIDVEIIADLKFVKRCRECGHFSSNINIDKIQPRHYNTVSFLNEDFILKVLKAQGKI